MVGRESGAAVGSGGGQRVQLPLLGETGDAPVSASLTNADIEELLIQDDAEELLDG